MPLNFHSGFETGDSSEWNQTELAAAYSFGVVASPTREGTTAGRLELRLSDSLTKAELRNVEWQPNYKFAGALGGVEMWYGISIYVPNWYVGTSGDYQILWQVHVAPNSGQNWTNPHFACWLNNQGWSYTNRYGAEGAHQQDQFNLGAAATEVWTDWVVRALWRGDNTGLLHIWKQVGGGGYTQVINKSGPTAYSERTRDYYNTCNIYRAGSSWPASPSERHVFFDSWRIWEGPDGFAEVQPGAGTVNGGGGGPPPGPPAKPTITVSPVDEPENNKRPWNTLRVSGYGGDPNADFWEVERDGVVIASPTTDPYDDTGLAPATSYTYRVRGVQSA